MNRRETIKSLLLGSVAAGLTLQGCAPKSGEKVDISKESDMPLTGRTPDELAMNKASMEAVFLNEHELSTIAVLCDIILPSQDDFGSATDAGVDDFIEFIVKDMPHHQTPVRGGLMWLDNFSNKSFGKNFKDGNLEQQKAICDQIAFPGKTDEALIQGEKFFTTMRNLTLTGYFTSKMGIADLGYKGNTPNVWDGVPDDVLKEHGFTYEEEWLAKCVNNDTRGDVAKWDDNGNLIS